MKNRKVKKHISEHAVSMGWVLNVLAGATFTEPGGAYNAIVRHWNAAEESVANYKARSFRISTKRGGRR